MNKSNGVQPAERFSKPETYEDATYGLCRVYDTRSWRQNSDRPKSGSQEAAQALKEKRRGGL